MSIACSNLIASPGHFLRKCALLVSLLFLSTWMKGAEADASPPIAGLQPDRRPMAPVITDVARSESWYARAFTGVEQPYPWSLRFVNEQGNWHNPFMTPGMTGPYDIRGWHRQSGIPAEKGNAR
jgi:hypothetical protein